MSLWTPSTGHRAVAAMAAIVCAVATAGCDGRMVLTDQAEARRLAAALHLEFVKASDAASRAVMSNLDDASAAAAQEARAATTAVQQHLEALQPIVRSLGYEDEIKILDDFAGRFAEFKMLDDEVLSLAVENTNLKAQRLAFGEGQDAAAAFFAALAKVTASPKGGDAGALAAEAKAAVLEIQVVQSRHIAEPDDAPMTRMEAQMAASEAAARRALERLRARSAAQPTPVDDAAKALDRFMTTNAEIVRLSRRNSNVRSLAVTLGRKRVVTAECADLLRALEETLAAHTFKATR